MNIFFDLDGTLIDARQRLYYLFKHLVAGCELTFDEYWEIKRKQLGHQHILGTLYGYDKPRIEEFTKQWMNEVEAEHRMGEDQPFAGVTGYLEKLSSFANLYIVTARQKPAEVVKQVDSFGWNSYFRDLLVTRQVVEKEDLIRAAVSTTKDDFIAGDTGKDIQTGKALGIHTIGVLSGFRNREQLLKYNPEYIIDIITDYSF